MHQICTTVLASIGLFLSFTSPAFAQQKACLMEGSISFGGQKTDIKDCLQNNGVPQAQFTELCSSLAQMGAALGGSPAKITYMAACPSQSQGSCEGVFGGPMTSYYYKRDAKTLPDVKVGCNAQGGKWK